LLNKLLVAEFTKSRAYRTTDNALVDSIRLELLRLSETDQSMDKTVADYSWGV